MLDACVCLYLHVCVYMSVYLQLSGFVQSAFFNQTFNYRSFHSIFVYSYIHMYMYVCVFISIDIYLYTHIHTLTILLFSSIYMPTQCIHTIYANFVYTYMPIELNLMCVYYVLYNICNFYIRIHGIPHICIFGP